jgi:hypothetical protein
MMFTSANIALSVSGISHLLPPSMSHPFTEDDLDFEDIFSQVSESDSDEEEQEGEFDPK